MARPSNSSGRLTAANQVCMGSFWFAHSVLINSDILTLIMVSNKASLQNQLQNPALVTLKNLIRPLTARLDDDYCSITVANNRLIIVIRFVAKNYTHPWKSFANKFRLVLYACEIFSRRIVCVIGNQQGLMSCG